MGSPSSGRGKILGIAKEATFGTGVAPAFFPKHTGFSGGLKPNLLKSKSRMGSRSAPPSIPDSVSGRIKVDMEVDPDNIGWYLKALCGSEVCAVDSGGTLSYKHTFTPQAGAVLPSFSLGLGYVVASMQAAGATLDSLSMNFTPKAIVEASAEFAFRDEGTQTTMTPTYTSLLPWVFTQLGLVVDSVTSADIKKVSIAAKNNIVDGDFRANDGGKVSSISAGNFDLSGTIEGVSTTETLALRTKMKAGTQVAIVITLTGSLIETGHSNKLTITIPYVVFDTGEIGDEDEGMSLPLPWTAGAGTNPIVTFDLINTRATAY